MNARHQSVAVGQTAGLPADAIIAQNPAAIFVLDLNHVVTHWNLACEKLTGVPAGVIIGTREHWRPFYSNERPVLSDIVLNGLRREDLDLYYYGRHSLTASVSGVQAEGFFPHLGSGGRWLCFTAAPLRDPDGLVVGAMQTVVDITEKREEVDVLRRSQEELEVQVQERTAELKAALETMENDIAHRTEMEAELMLRYDEMSQLNERLQQTQEQLLQSEKMASVGQLAAGVAHEINNPIGYVNSNFGRLEKYVADLLALISLYEKTEAELPATGPMRREVSECKRALDLEFLREDIPALLSETQDGIGRVRKIVQDLKDFSRAGNTRDWQWVHLHHGLDSTINIATNEIKYRAQLLKEYGSLPEIECLPSELNQVFMNLLVNAAHAIAEPPGTITVRTGAGENTVWVEVSDTGTGIKPEDLKRIFDPFFTTKPIGKGTGLGLSLSYGIVQKHHGTIDVQSELGKGTTFRVTLPLRQTPEAPKANP